MNLFAFECNRRSQNSKGELFSQVSVGVVPQQATAPVIDPEAPAISCEMRGLMEDDLSRSFVIVLTGKPRFLDLVPGSPNP